MSPRAGCASLDRPRGRARLAALATAAVTSVAINAGAAATAQAQGKPAVAESFPTRPVRLIAASAPGGGIDILARVLAQRLAESWQQQVLVDNRSGGGGLIATELTVNAAADGHTLLMQSVGVSYVGTLNRRTALDVVHDLAPVASVATQPSILVANPSVPVSSLTDLISLARTRPNQVTFGSGGAGGASHMGTELLASAARIRMVHVPYKGTGPSMAAVLSGEVNVALVGISTSLPHVKSGKVRALGVSSSARSALAPDIPTLAEAGVTGYEFSGWYGVFAPAKVPAAVLDRTHGAISTLLRQPELAQQLAGNGFEPFITSQDAFRKYFAAEVRKWKRVIAEVGITAQ
jgi:tripartite-type tricarboxylate transporter receptor subunit TctC